MSSLLLISLLLATAPVVTAEPLGKNEVPPELAPWINWVQYNNPSRNCYSSSLARNECTLYNYLRLDISDSGATFELSGINLKIGVASVTLPAQVGERLAITSGAKNVTSDEENWYAVVPSGPFVIRGKISWDTLPETLYVPENIAIINATYAGRQLMPLGDDPESLLIKSPVPVKAEATAEPANQPKKRQEARMQVRRRITMNRPVGVSAHYIFRCPVKDELLTLPLPEDFLLEQVLASGQLIPASEGALTYRCPAGRSVVVLEGRLLSGKNMLKALPDTGKTPILEDDIVVFTPDQRRWESEVSVKKGMQVEAANVSELPINWRSKLATVWRLEHDGELSWTAKEIHNKNADKAIISLERNMVVADGGESFHVKDTLSLTNNTLPSLALTEKSFTVLGMRRNSADALIFKNEAGLPTAAMENSSELLESTMWWQEKTAGWRPQVVKIPAAGYSEKVHKGSLSLKLLPGWVPLAAWGAEDYSGDYIRQLSLYNLLLGVLAFVLVYLGAWRIKRRNIKILIALGAMIATITSPWLDDGLILPWFWCLSSFLIISLLGHLGADHRKLKKVSTILLSVISVPFLIMLIVSWMGLVRTALHPTLPGGHSDSISIDYFSNYKNDSAAQSAPRMAKAMAAMDEEMEFAEEEAAPMAKKEAPSHKMQKESIKRKGVLSSLAAGSMSSMVADNDALAASAKAQQKKIRPVGLSAPRVATGNRITMYFNSPLKEDSRFSVLLVPPFWRGVALFLYIFFSVIAFLSFFGVSISKLKKVPVAALIFLALLPNSALAAEGNYPPAEFLRDLEVRTRPARCEGSCQQISDFNITLNNDLSFTMTMTASSVIGDLLPLPGPWYLWQAKEITVQGRTAAGIKNDSYIYVLVPAGVSTITVRGKMAPDAAPRISFPIFTSGISLKSERWSLEHNEQYMEPGVAISLLSAVEAEDTKVEEDAEEVDEDIVVPDNQVPLAKRIDIVRRINFSDPNSVNTAVSARGLRNGDIVDIPLLPGEVVSAYAEQIKEGKLRLVADGPTLNIRFNGTLPAGESLTLAAPDSANYIETWFITCDTSRACAFSKEPRPATAPQPAHFEPNPGEKLVVSVKERAVLAGNNSEGNFRLYVTSSQGSASYNIYGTIRLAAMDKVTLKIPAEARVQSFKIDDNDHPARPENGELTFLLGQGISSIDLKYNIDGEPSLFTRFAPVSASIPLVNTTISYNTPSRRVVLASLGSAEHHPVVLYWSVFMAHLLLALLVFFFCRFLLPDVPMKLYQWILLLVPLASISSYMLLALIIPMLLLALPLKAKAQPRWGRFLGLIAILLALISALVGASGAALLSAPDMSIHNSVYGNDMTWLIGYLPAGQAIEGFGAFSIPIWLWKCLQFIWCLWLIWLCKGWYPLVASRFVAALHRDKDAPKAAAKADKPAEKKADAEPKAAAESAQPAPAGEKKPEKPEEKKGDTQPKNKAQQAPKGGKK